MKISTKLTLIISIIFALFFSLAYNISIYENTKQNIDAAIHRNLEAHSLNDYYLQANLINYISSHRATPNDRDFLYDMAKMLADYQGTSTSFCLKNKNHHTIYANTDIIFSKYAFESEKNGKAGYLMVTIDNKEWMLVRSVITIENNVYFLYTGYDMSSMYQNRDQQLRNFYLIAIIVQMLSIICIHFFIKKLTHPINRLNMISKDISDGDYAKRTDIHTNDEIGELSRNFDNMAAAIEGKLHEVEDAMHQRELFMGAFSHELKTPMTSIIGYSDMLMNMDVSQEDKQKAYSFIHKEGKRLEVLSHELLSLFVIQHRDIELESIDTKALCNHLLDTEIQFFSDVIVTLDIEQACIKANEDLLVCLLQNLIKNAIKAIPKDRQVRVIGYRIEDTYAFYVLDYGKGMRKEDVKQCLNPFYMVDKSRSRQQGSNGLGLTICKEIIEYHRSHLHIDSIENVGTCVSFQLEVCDEE